MPNIQANISRGYDLDTIKKSPRSVKAAQYTWMVVKRVLDILTFSSNKIQISKNDTDTMRSSENLLLAANHVAWHDSPIVQQAIRRAGWYNRSIYTLMARSESPILRWWWAVYVARSRDAKVTDKELEHIPAVGIDEIWDFITDIHSQPGQDLLYFPQARQKWWDGIEAHNKFAGLQIRGVFENAKNTPDNPLVLIKLEYHTSPLISHDILKQKYKIMKILKPIFKRNKVTTHFHVVSDAARWDRLVFQKEFKDFYASWKDMKNW